MIIKKLMARALAMVALLSLVGVLSAPSYAGDAGPHKGSWGYHATLGEIPASLQPLAQPVVGGGYWLPHSSRTCLSCGGY